MRAASHHKQAGFHSNTLGKCPCHSLEVRAAVTGCGRVVTYRNADSVLVCHGCDNTGKFDAEAPQPSMLCLKSGPAAQAPHDFRRRFTRVPLASNQLRI